jgi:hypothetical protein
MPLCSGLNLQSEQYSDELNPPVWTILGTGLSVQQLEALVKMNMLEPAENFVKALLTTNEIFKNRDDAIQGNF